MGGTEPPSSSRTQESEEIGPQNVDQFGNKVKSDEGVNGLANLPSIASPLEQGTQCVTPSNPLPQLTSTPILPVTQVDVERFSERSWARNI